MDRYREANRANWDQRAPVHAASGTYALDRLISDPARLTGVVEFDRPWLGDVSGLRLLHLQCHIGSDTVSWGKLGAQVTGYDFSPASLAVARDLAARCRLQDASFVEGELYDAPQRLPQHAYDVVYTGVGALNWLPDIRRWADVVARLLAPGGRLLLREGHPMLWALDHDREDDLLVVSQAYFETEQPDEWQDTDTYTDNGAGVLTGPTYEWNHGLGEILTAVLDAGLTIERFAEHRELAWPAWHLFQEDPQTGRCVLPPRLRDRVPLMYSLLARAPAVPAAAGDVQARA